MPLISVKLSLTFEIWAIDFIGPFLISVKRIGASYIITAVEYVTKWAESELVDTCSSEIATCYTKILSPSCDKTLNIPIFP